MVKDKTILKFIERLKSAINFTLVEIVDYWEADLCAIGLKREDRIVYISTFNYIESDELKYDFDMELINGRDSEKIEIIKKGRGVSQVELMDEIKVFLKI